MCNILPRKAEAKMKTLRRLGVDSDGKITLRQILRWKNVRVWNWLLWDKTESSARILTLAMNLDIQLVGIKILT